MNTLAEKTCWIMGAGEHFEDMLRIPEGDLLIAADGGMAELERMGLTPDLIVGDFDSLGYAPEGGNVMRLPVEKDETDMEMCVRLGVERGAARFFLFGGTGGRISHTLANTQLLCRLASRGLKGFLFGGRTVITAVKDSAEVFPAGLCGSVSLFPQGGEIRHVTETGLKYALDDAVLAPDAVIGVSNSFTGAEASIEVGEGTALIICEFDREEDVWNWLARA